MLSKSFRATALRRATNYYSRAYATRYPSTPQGPRNSIRRPDLPRPIDRSPGLHRKTDSKSREAAELPEALSETNPAENTLLSPVHIPQDPNAVLKENHPAAKILANSGLVIRRELELMNVLLSFEQENRYSIFDAQGNHIGYIAERGGGFGKTMARQWFRTHRSFTAHVFDLDRNEILRIHRPFALINSHIRVYDPLNPAEKTYSTPNSQQLASTSSLAPIAEDPDSRISQLPLSDMRVIGEVQQQWAPLRRKYNMFLYHPNPTAETNLGAQQINEPSNGLSQSQWTQLVRSSGKPDNRGEYHQFAYVDEPFLSWDFSLRSADDRLVGSVNRNFSGFAKEIFTDMGTYVLRMDSAALAEDKERQIPTSQPGQELVTQSNNMTAMTLDQRAVMLATAVSIDFDYFSRHSHSTGFFPWLWFPGGSSAEGAAAGGAAEAATGAGTAAETTAIGEAGATAVGRAGAAGSIAEGTAAGAAGVGSMAAHDALQRGVFQETQSDPFYGGQPSESTQSGQNNAPEEVWGEVQDPWGSRGSGADRSGGGGGGGPDDKSGGIDLDDFDFF